MAKHIDSLEFYIPNIKKLHVLDVGAGRGKFLIECAEANVNAEGIEYNNDNVQKVNNKAKELGLKIKIAQGQAENLPYPNNSFDFVNLSEVIEHVQDPHQVLKEVNRVLKIGGRVYISVPNRFGWFDHHFHLAFVNWLPRSFSSGFISLFKKHKAYGGESGLQRLDEMHYYTFSGFKKEAQRAGFEIQDMRIIKIKRKVNNSFLDNFLVLGYIFMRFWYLESFHFLLTKKYAAN